MVTWFSYVYRTVCLVLLIPTIIGGVNSSSLGSCELEGICAIHSEEKRFSCGEELENITRNDLPAEYSTVWCFRNGTWYSTVVSISALRLLRSSLKSMEFSLYEMVGRCVESSPTLKSKIVSMKVHGGIISSDMSMEMGNTFLATLEEMAFDDNNITTITNTTFTRFERLRSISLSYNRITVIEKCSLPIRGSVISFNITANDLDCCSIQHFKHWETYWKKEVVYGACKLKDRMIDFREDFTAQCSNHERFDCIPQAEETLLTKTEENFTTKVTTTEDKLTTEDSEPFLQTGLPTEGFLRTILLAVFGVSLAVATGVTIGTLKYVHRRAQRVACSGDHSIDLNVNDIGVRCIEKQVEKLFRTNQNNLGLHTSNNIPPTLHQFKGGNFLSRNLEENDSILRSTDNVNLSSIDNFPYTVEGYLDLSYV